jgi:hypothetical protein
MKNLKIIIPVLLTVLIVSCNRPYERINTDEVQSAFILNSSPTFKGYYYQGTDNEFHYFVSKWDLKKDILFKLKKEDSIFKPERLGFRNWCKTDFTAAVDIGGRLKGSA